MKNNNININVLRHSAAHIMAYAIKYLFPNSKLAIGPSIENGFYYDFEITRALTNHDLIQIESKMKEIIEKNYAFIHLSLPRKIVIEKFNNNNEKYKLEIISQIPGNDNLSIYQCGNFIDLCKGPHITSTGELKYFKLLSVAGAYWRGDEKREQLQRIYGTAFLTQQSLTDYLNNLIEVKKRDHRLLGKNLDLFSIDDSIGGGLILWHPKGTILKKIIENYWEKLHTCNSYELISTPHITSDKLFSISGHLQTYSEYMFAPMQIEGNPYRIKPMNCPMHLAIYKTRLHSYRDLPVRYAELGTVYRFEKSGVLYGLLRVRGFTQDDGHVIVSPHELENEILKTFKMAIDCLTTFGFKEYKIYLATKPEKNYVGKLQDWDIAQASIERVLHKIMCKYEIDQGGGAFYGPKIDIKIKDAIGRLWQCSTIQVDFNLPERFDIYYIDKHGNKQRPYMIHRALMGSIERFIGILLEHYEGKLPLWLSPIQVAILTINQEQKDYCETILKILKNNNIRVMFNDNNFTIGHKIRDSIHQKIPYVIVIGKNEQNLSLISVRRTKDNTNLGTMTINNFIDMLKTEIYNKV
ncbi:MAG: threonine--tRNA ligase [Endomicrobium sp.]|jgi:threonyl-tRNA synthetase|nr:threonine--tRNA ligase [Endomicrobium sp.]